MSVSIKHSSILIRGIVATSSDTVRFRIRYRGVEAVATMARRDYGWHLNALDPALNGLVSWTGAKSQREWRMQMSAISERLVDILGTEEVENALAAARLLDAMTAAKRVALQAA